MNQKKLSWYELPPERWRNNNTRIYWERDSQRQKLYDAQSIAKCRCKSLGRQIPSIKVIQIYVDWLTSEAWFIKRFGTNEIEVKEKRGTGADACWKVIRFSKDSRSLLTILHEVAHVVHKSGYGSSHGRFFARTLLELVEHKIGREAAKALKKAFKKYGVKYLPKRELTKETREKLRQGFVDRVLKQKG